VTRALADDEVDQARAEGSRLTLAEVVAGLDVTASAPA